MIQIGGERNPVYKLMSVGILDDGSACFSLARHDDEFLHVIDSQSWKDFLNGPALVAGLRFSGMPLIPDQGVFLEMHITERTEFEVDAIIVWVSIGDEERGWIETTFS